MILYLVLTVTFSTVSYLLIEYPFSRISIYSIKKIIKNQRDNSIYSKNK